MPDPQLPDTVNEEISEWCGWRWWKYVGHPGEWRVVAPGGPNLRCENLHDALPKYTEDLNACAEFERLVEERGLAPEYVVEFVLTDMLRARVDALYQIRRGVRYEDYASFAFATATPEQRCAALLKVIKG